MTLHQVERLLFGVAVSTSLLLARQTQTAKPTVQAVKIEREIRLSGKLDDPLWNLATPVTLPFEIQPGENTPAQQITTARVLYSADNLYIGFNCNDTKPEEIRAQISDRDRIYNDDFVLIILDTYDDNQKAYEFLVNPYGIQADILRTGNNEDDTFDSIWQSAAAKNDSGWTVEMEIPFKSLRFPTTDVQRWGIMFGRVFPRDSRRIFSWTQVDRNNPCFTCQGGSLMGIRGIESTTSVEMLPYVLGSHSGALINSDQPSEGFEYGKPSGRIGGGVRYAPSPSLAVDAVVNPDFSQVESDAQQISVNTTFALFYPEKRPFFAQGTDLFQSQNQNGPGYGQIFYSRSINNPIGAAKVTGKTGKLSYAYLAASDRNTPFTIPGEEKSNVVESGIQSFSNAARVKYDIGDESFVGGLATARNTTAAHNYVAGIDWNYLFWGNYYFRGETYFSNTKELNDLTLFSDTRRFGSTGYTAAFDGQTYGGFAGRAMVLRNARDYSFNLAYLDVSPTFQAQDGFVASNNRRLIVFDNWYTLYPNNHILDYFGPEVAAGLHWNYDGTLKERWCVPSTYFQFKGQTSVSVVYLLVNDEMFRGIWFDKIRRGVLNVNSRPLSAIAISLYGEAGRFIHRSDAPTMGRGHNLGMTISLRPTSQLQVDVSYNRARLSDDITDELFYDGNITRAVGTYQFTAELFLRTIVQYNSFDEAISIYPLLSYKLNPFTIFYAGVTDDLQRYSSIEGFTTTARQFFVKFQYLFRS